MGYDEFRAEYDAVMNACLTAKLDMDGLANAVSRLAEHRDRLPTDGQRHRAGADIAELEEILDLARQTPYSTSPAFNEASRALSRATMDTGSTTERIDRARRGIEEIGAIADRITDTAERYSVLQMTEPLAMLIESLESHPREGSG